MTNNTTPDKPVIEQPAVQPEQRELNSYLREDQIIRFMRFRKPMALFSLLIVLLGVVSLFTKGLNLGLDFTGGIAAEASYTAPVKTEQVISALNKAGFTDPVVQFLGTQRDVMIKLPPQGKENLSMALSKALQLPSNNATLSKVESVGSQTGAELYWRAVGAIVLSLVLMFVYVAFRFEMKLAVGAVISLIHDTLFTIGVFSVFGWPFDLTVLAAVLALIGYSLNDTIVVFDRVRENFRKIRGAEPDEVVDVAITETLRRTIMTVTTVLLVVIAMFFLGGDGLYWFSVALLVGLVAGTYSSIYIATSYALAMGLKRKDFLIKVKAIPEEEEIPEHYLN